MLWRTLRHLQTTQIVHRPLYRLRRGLVAPIRGISETLGRIGIEREGTGSFGRSSPASLNLDVTPLEDWELEIAGERHRIPLVAPFEPTGGGPLYAYAFHELGWLVVAMKSKDVSPERITSLQSWLRDYCEWEADASSPYWDPYPLGARILNLRILGIENWIDVRIARSMMASHMPVLRWLLERHLGANHLLRNRAALFVGAQCLALPSAMRKNTVKNLVREVNAQFLTDGTHEECVPGYHLLAVWDVLQTVACDATLLDYLAPILAKAVGALELLAHRDGRLCAFGDTAPQSLPCSNTMIEWAQKIDVSIVSPAVGVSGDWRRQTLGEGGFSRLQQRRLDVFLRHGGLGAMHQPGHAHCDLFALELDLDGCRLVVDPGVHSYHDPKWRSLTRASSVHCTPSVRGEEQAELWKSFRCGWRSKVIEDRWQRTEKGWAFRGHAEAFGPHRPRGIERNINFNDASILVRDRVGGQSGTVQVALPFAPRGSCRARRGIPLHRRGTAIASARRGMGCLLSAHRGICIPCVRG